GRFGAEGLGVDGLGLLHTLIYDQKDRGCTLAAMHALLLIGTLEYEQHGTMGAIDELIRALRYAPHAGEPRDRKDFGTWDTPNKEYVIGFTDEEVASGARTDAFIRFAAAFALAQLDIDELQRRALEPMLKALGDEEVSVVDNAFHFF